MRPHISHRFPMERAADAFRAAGRPNEHRRSDAGDTFQAIARHSFTDPLKNPGLADVTAHVDFQALVRGVGRRRQDQEHPGTIGLVSLRGVPEPVVSDLVKASRQDVLEKAPEELNARQPLGAPRHRDPPAALEPARPYP